MSANLSSMQLRMRKGLRENRFVQRLLGLRSHISLFGLANNKRRSVRNSLFEMFCFTLAFGSFMITVIMIWFGLYEFGYLSNWDTSEKALAEVDLNWWEYLNILLLIVGIFWPAYIRERDARIQFSKQGTFSSRIMISLNCCAITSDMSKSEQRLNVPNLFYMRTLTEEGISTFFPDEVVQVVIDKSKRLRMRHGRAQMDIKIREEEEAKAKLEAEEEEEKTAAEAATDRTSSQINSLGGANAVPQEGGHVQVAVHVGDISPMSAGAQRWSEVQGATRSVAQVNTFAEIAQAKVNASKMKKKNNTKFGLKKLQEYKARKMDGDFLELESEVRDVITSLKPLPAQRPGLGMDDYGGLDKIFFFDPIMTIPYSYKDRYNGLLDHVRNNISKLSTPGHLRMDANLPSVSEEYVFALLCEDYKKKTAINAKLRIALVRRATLNKIGEMAQRGLQPDWEVVRTWNGGLNIFALGFFKKRWLTLVYMHDQLVEIESKPANHEAMNKRRLLGSVSLTFAVQGLPRRDRSTTFAVVPEATDNSRGIGSPDRLPGVAHMDSDSESGDEDDEEQGGRESRSASDITVSSGPGESPSALANSMAALKMTLGSWVSGSSVSYPKRSPRRKKQHRSRSFS